MQYFGECFYCTKRNRCLDAHRNTRCRDYEKRRRSGTDYKKCPKSSLHTPDSTAGVPGTGKEGHESIQSGSEWEEEKDIRVLSVQSGGRSECTC